MKTTNPGIDYTPIGSTINRDPDNNIRYGVISTNAVSRYAMDDISDHGTDEDFQSFADQVKSELIAAIEGVLKNYLRDNDASQVVEAAIKELNEHLGDNYEGTGDCARFSYESDGYKLQTDSGGDLWVLKSPYKTCAQFCSPCAPGACYLTSPCEDGAWAYCLGPDWFDQDNPCPYPVFRVDTEARVKA